MEEKQRARYGIQGEVQNLPALSGHTTLLELLYVDQIGSSQIACSGVLWRLNLIYMIEFNH